MKNKGFTLIELLAVIVILAIIALIATPIVLGIINNARDESDKRSIDLYAKSIENYVAKSQLNGTAVAPGDLSSELLNAVEYDGSRVACETNKLYSDGTIYLSGCTVGGKAVDYTYGEEKTNTEEEYVQVFVPDYRSVELNGTLNETEVTGDQPSERPTGSNIYLGYDVNNDKVSAIYVCVFRNSKEYCLKGADVSAYSDNQGVLSALYSDVDNACSIDNEESLCIGDGIITAIDSEGGLMVFDSTIRCYFDGTFECNLINS